MHPHTSSLRGSPYKKKEGGEKENERSRQRKRKGGKSRQVTTGYFAVVLIRTSKKHHFARFVRDKEGRKEGGGEKRRSKKGTPATEGCQQNWQKGRQWKGEWRNKTAQEIPLAFPPSWGKSHASRFYEFAPSPPSPFWSPLPSLTPREAPSPVRGLSKRVASFCPSHPFFPRGEGEFSSSRGSSTLPLLDDVLRASLGSPTVDPFVFLPGLCRRYARMFEIVPEHLSSPLSLSSTAEA